MKNKNLSFFQIAFLYVGTIMGAGFASGREIWQFFGIFGSLGYVGVFVVGVLFVAIGIMTSIIARKMDTNHMGKIIVPGGHPKLVSLVSGFMALMLFTVLITMSSAGGALFAQQLGQSRVLGGAVIIVLVVITVIGGFNRVSGVFRIIMPVLFCVVVGTCFLVITKEFPPSEAVGAMSPSPLAPKWWLSAILYVSYNVLAVVPIVATASIHGKSTAHAVAGSGLGGVFVAVLALVLVSAMNTDPSFSQSVDMPMLGFSQRLSPGINIIYTCVLLFAIYASATSNYYGFTTKLKPSPGKKRKVAVIGAVGFLFGLIGFKNVVAYMFPLEGFMGIIIIIMVVINFIIVIKNTSNREGEDT